MAKSVSPFDTCLAPLARIAAKSRALEGQVVWWEDGGWQAQEDEEAMLDAEELAFYAEGLLTEGFGLHWQVLADADAKAAPALALLFFWQGAAPAIPALEAGWTLLAEGRHPVN